MIKILAGFVLALFSTLCAADDSEWIRVASTDTHIWEAKRGSLEHGTTEKSQVPVVSAIFRLTKKGASSASFERKYVRHSDCTRGYGKLVTTDLNGSFQFENDFVVDGGSVGSWIAEILCLKVKDERSQNKSDYPT